MKKLICLTLAVLFTGAALCVARAEENLPPAHQQGGNAPIGINESSVVAKVNGHVITAKMLDYAVGMSMAQYDPKNRYFSDSVYKKVLDNIIDRELISEAAEKLYPGPEVDTRFKSVFGEVKKSYGEAGGYEKELKKLGLNDDEMRDYVKKDVLIMMYYEREIPPPKEPTEAEIEKYYGEHKDSYSITGTTRISQILFAFPENPTDSEIKTLKIKAEDVLKKIRAGEDFAELAKKYSDHAKSASRGGDMGYLDDSQTVEPFKTLFPAMTVGQVSEVVRGPSGFHIVKLVDRESGKTYKLEEVHRQVVDNIKDEQSTLSLMSKVSDLRKNAKIELLSKHEQ